MLQMPIFFITFSNLFSHSVQQCIYMIIIVVGGVSSGGYFNIRVVLREIQKGEGELFLALRIALMRENVLLKGILKN